MKRRLIQEAITRIEDQEEYRNTISWFVIEDALTFNTINFNFSYNYEEYITAFDIEFAGKVFRKCNSVALNTSTLLSNNLNRDLSVQIDPPKLLLLPRIKTLPELTVMTEVFIFSELTVL